MRESGILLPIFSLPSPYGIGSLGKAAYDFVDFLEGAGQSCWQILPLCPTIFGNSPYQSFSVFSGNPYFIDLDMLCDEGLLKKDELPATSDFGGKKIDYGYLYSTRHRILEKACNRFSIDESEFRKFEYLNGYWLEDCNKYLFYKNQNPLLWRKIQFLFFRQWFKLKKYANDKNVEIIGDLPIYVARDSADYFADEELFQKGFVAACPPDSFNEKGQLWGNPLYDWEKMKNDGYEWFLRRFKQASQLYDRVRIDHFRGFYEYYRVEEGREDATVGEWVKGPGMDLVKKIKDCYPKLKIIAEDLGYLNDEVKSFFKESGFPGMKVLQFAFENGGRDYLPHNYEKNSVAYTGTHDNPTLKEWICIKDRNEITYAMDYLGVCHIAFLPEGFIRGVLSSKSALAITTMQDWLSENCHGRINTPGRSDNNWEYRLPDDALCEGLSRKIRRLTELYERI